MPRTPKPTRLLEVAFVNEYGQRRIMAHVCCEIPTEHGTKIRRESGSYTARPTGPLRGEALEDFRITCYVGHYRNDADLAPSRLWGWGYEFKPFVVDSEPRAERILRTMREVRKASARLADHVGDTPTFDLFLWRMAIVVGATKIRVWIPSPGSKRHLSDPLPLAQGAQDVVAMADAWGRSGYAEMPEEIVRRWLDPPHDEADHIDAEIEARFLAAQEDEDRAEALGLSPLPF